MDPQTVKLVLLALFGWGTGGFIAKLAANRIGSRSIFWDMIGYAVVAVVYSLIIFKPSNIASGDKTGIAMAITAGVINSTLSCFDSNIGFCVSSRKHDVY